MYFWKCWRDTRRTYFMLLSTGVLLAAAVSLSLMCHYRVGTGFQFDSPRTPLEIENVWRQACMMVSLTGAFLSASLGAALGSAGLGEELQNGTAAFLFTRPRPRAYFLHIRWAVTAAQLAAFSITVPLALVATFFLCTHRDVSTWTLALSAIFFTFSLLSFALTDLFTLVRENVRDGVALAALISIAWLLGIPVINAFWSLHLPTPMDVIFRFVPSLPIHPPWLAYYWLRIVAAWVVMALTLMIPARYVLERKEI